MLINELLGIKYPIFQGAMANIATPEFCGSRIQLRRTWYYREQAPWTSTRHGKQSVPVSSLRTSRSVSCYADESAYAGDHAGNLRGACRSRYHRGREIPDRIFRH